MDAASHTGIGAIIASAVATRAGLTIDTLAFVNYLLFQFTREVAATLELMFFPF